MAESIKPNGAIFEPMMEDDDAEKPLMEAPKRNGQRGSRRRGCIKGGLRKPSKKGDLVRSPILRGKVG